MTSFVSRTVRLAFLAPDITLSIHGGRQPEGLNVTRVLRDSNDLPLALTDQRQFLGFPPADQYLASGTADSSPGENAYTT